MESHTKMTPFVSLECARRKRSTCVSELLLALLDAGYQLLIVVTKPPLQDRAKALSLAIPKGSKFRIYAVTLNQQIDTAVRLLVSMPLWHKPVFHVLIGGSGFMKLAVEIFKRTSKTSLIDIENDLEPYVLGFFDPVDDALECYGGLSLQRTIDGLSSWTCKGKPINRAVDVDKGVTH